MEVVELSGPPGQLCAVSLFMIDPTLGIIGRGATDWITGSPAAAAPFTVGKKHCAILPPGCGYQARKGQIKCLRGDWRGEQLEPRVRWSSFIAA